MALEGLSVPSRPRELIETSALVVILIVLSTGPVYFVAQHIFHAEGMWEARPIKAAYLLCSVLCVATWLSAAVDRRLKKPDLPLTLGAIFSIVAVLSTLWSILERQTLWRSSVYVAMLLAAWVIASLNFDRLWFIILAFASSTTLASVFVAVLRPEMGVAEGGRWRGIFTSPNSLGPVCAITIICLLGLVFLNRNSAVRVAAWAAIAVTLVPLAKSGSTTSALALIVAIAVSASLWFIAKVRSEGEHEKSIRIAVAAGVVGLIGVIGSIPFVIDESGIQQRLDVWPIVWERILRKPWLGYGFFTYWGTETSMHPRTIGRAGSAHNSVLEAGLDMGFLGMAVVLATLVIAVWFSISRVLRSPTKRHALVAILGLFVVLSHLTESFVSWFSYMWVLLIVVASGVRTTTVNDRGGGSVP